jgi:hypothetical protein
MAAVGRGCFGDLKIIEACFKLPIAFIEILLQTVGIYHGVIRGIGIDEAGIGKELCAINKTGLNAL